jgi:hypothetical protein
MAAITTISAVPSLVQKVGVSSRTQLVAASTCDRPSPSRRRYQVQTSPLGCAGSSRTTGTT